MAETTATDGADAPVLTELTPEQEKALTAFAANWPQVAREQPPDRDKIEQVLSRLYKLVESDLPPVIWCQGPWDLVASKVLITLNSLKDEEHAELIDAVIDRLAELPEWRQLWRQVKAVIQEKKLSCDDCADQTRFGLGSVNNEIIQKENLYTGQAKEKLGTLLSLQIKLKLRRALRQENDDRENARLRLALRNRQIVVTQFGLLSVALFLGDRLPRELTQHLTPEVQTQLAVLCQQKWPDTRPHIPGITTKPDPLAKLYSTMHGRLNSFDDVFDLQPVAFFVEHTPELLPTDIVQPIRDWLTLKDQLFHVELFEKVCFVCERPNKAILNERSQLHNSNGPAMTFRDGCEVFAWNGVVLPSAAVMATDQLTIDQIDKEQNVEVRRILIQQYGMERYLNDSNAVKVDEDEYGVLYRKSQALDEPIVVVRVLNPTPEPDGTNKFYFLRVPPYITTARQAVAWTFNMEEKDYEPAKQS